MRKATSLALSVLAGLATAVGCGGSKDYAPNFVGTYSGSYTVTLTSNTTGQSASGSYPTVFQITEGASASDLVIGGGCGMTGHATSATSFITFQSSCPAYDSSTNCAFTYNLQAGNGTKNAASLAMSIPGTATINCPAGSDTGTLVISWSLTQL